MGMIFSILGLPGGIGLVLILILGCAAQMPVYLFYLLFSVYAINDARDFDSAALMKLRRALIRKMSI